MCSSDLWAAYASRIEAVGELQKAGIRSAQTLPLENVNAEIPQELQELENDCLLYTSRCV